MWPPFRARGLSRGQRHDVGDADENYHTWAAIFKFVGHDERSGIEPDIRPACPVASTPATGSFGVRHDLSLKQPQQRSPGWSGVVFFYVKRRWMSDVAVRDQRPSNCTRTHTPSGAAVCVCFVTLGPPTCFSLSLGVRSGSMKNTQKKVKEGQVHGEERLEHVAQLLPRGFSPALCRAITAVSFYPVNFRRIGCFTPNKYEP